MQFKIFAPIKMLTDRKKIWIEFWIHIQLINDAL